MEPVIHAVAIRAKVLLRVYVECWCGPIKTTVQMLIVPYCRFLYGRLECQGMLFLKTTGRSAS